MELLKQVKLYKDCGVRMSKISFIQLIAICVMEEQEREPKKGNAQCLKKKCQSQP